MCTCVRSTTWERGIPPPREGTRDLLKPFALALLSSVKLSHEIFISEQLANWGVVIVIRAMINCVAFDFVAEPKMWVGLN